MDANTTGNLHTSRELNRKAQEWEDRFADLLQPNCTDWSLEGLQTMEKRLSKYEVSYFAVQLFEASLRAIENVQEPAHTALLWAKALYYLDHAPSFRNEVARISMLRRMLEHELPLEVEARTHLELADKYTANRRSLEAETHLAAAAKLVTRPEDAAFTKFIRARICSVRGEYTSARELLHAARAQFAEISQIAGQARCVSALAVLEMNNGRVEAALEGHQQALRMYRAAGDLDGMIRELGSSAGALGRLGQLDQSLVCLDECDELATLTGNQAVLARNKGNRALAQMNRGDYDGAVRAFRDALASFHSLDDMDGVSAGLLNLALAYAAKGDLQAAEVTYVKAEGLLKQLGDKKRLATLHGNRTMIRIRQGRYDEATADADSCEELCRAIGDMDQLVYVQLARGSIHERQGRYEPALGYFRNAVDLSRKTGRRLQLALMLSRLARGLCFIRDWSEALAFGSEALDCFMETETCNTRDYFYALSTVVVAELELGNAVDASALAKDAIELSIKLQLDPTEDEDVRDALVPIHRALSFKHP